MSSFRIEPGPLRGEITIPSSKSHTLRALVFALMAKGKSLIYDYLAAPDTDAMLTAISHFGAKVRVFPHLVEVEGVGGKLKPAEDVIQAGNSGIVFRFMAGIAALSKTYSVITGDHSIRHTRPIQSLLDALNQLGVFAVSTRKDGHAPILIRGPLIGCHTSVSGEDSQPVSALLIALGFVPDLTTLTVKNPKETSWIDLTLFWMRKLGMRVEHDHYEQYRIRGKECYEGFEVKIPGDLSSAAYPLAAALITGSEIVLRNIDLTECHGDRKLIEILRRMGAQIEVEASTHSLYVRGGQALKGVDIDIDECIDMVTILPIVACFAEGKTRIVNGQIARSKESDRIRSIASELQKMGAQIEEHLEGLTITPSPLIGAHVQSYEDHRMALALSVAALASKGPSLVEGVQSIAKTYSTFKEDFIAMGARIF